MTTQFQYLKCPCCGNVTKKLEKVTFVKDIIYERVRLTPTNTEVISYREDGQDINKTTNSIYRCIECGFETGDLTTFGKGDTYGHRYNTTDD